MKLHHINFFRPRNFAIAIWYHFSSSFKGYWVATNGTMTGLLCGLNRTMYLSYMMMAALWIVIDNQSSYNK